MRGLRTILAERGGKYTDLRDPDGVRGERDFVNFRLGGIRFSYPISREEDLERETFQESVKKEQATTGVPPKW